MASKGRAQEAAAAPLFKVDEDTRKAVAAVNAAGQSGCRMALEVVVAETTGSSLRADARAAAASACGGDSSFAMVRHLLDRSLRTSVRLAYEQADILSGLVAMGVAEPVAKDVAMAVKARGQQLADAYTASAPRHPSVVNVRWRVDVVISSSALNRVMRPTILMELTLSDGKIHAMEVPVDKFHELRYSAAKLLSEMGAVESHPVLSIA